MADVDENAPVLAGPYQNDNDLTDETQDFSFLSNLPLYDYDLTGHLCAYNDSNTEQLSLPRRGDKDFEPHGTTSQQNALSRARAAMHEALSFPRIHTPKYRITATYDPDRDYIVVDNPRGHHFRTMGKAEADGRLYLLPEEALYLVERGNLDLRWPAGGGHNNEGDNDEGIPLSLQSAYAALIGQLGLTLERYSVYIGLKRCGYIVTRGLAWCPDGWGEYGKRELQPTQESNSAFEWLYALLRRPQTEESPPLGPLLRPGLYRSFSRFIHCSSLRKTRSSKSLQERFTLASG